MIIMVCVLQFIKAVIFAVIQSQRSAILCEEVALKITSLFGSTYRCEQFLKKMKHCKGKHRGADINFVWGGAVSDVSLTVGKLI